MAKANARKRVGVTSRGIQEKKSISRERAKTRFETSARVLLDVRDGKIETPPGRIVTAPVARKLVGEWRVQRVKQSVKQGARWIDTSRSLRIPAKNQTRH